MVRLAALDLVLWIVRTGMVRVAFDLELARTHADDRAADTSSLGIPAHPIMYPEGLRQVIQSDATKELQRGTSRTECNLPERREHQLLHSLSVP